MAKPRKHQVRNLKTEFKSHPNGSAGIAFGGGKSQTISGSNLTNFLSNYSVTGKLGGSDQSCPAFIYGGVGPWVVPVSSSFNIQIPGINNNQPVKVTIQASDFVKSDGVNVLTSGKLARKINTTLGFSAYNTTACAFVEQGRIVLRSTNLTETLVGESAFVTLSTITSGLLSTLGFTSNAVITEFGKDSSTRGIVTDTYDARGGFVQLRDTQTGSQAYPKSGVYRQSLTEIQGIEPEEDTCSPIFARIKKSKDGGQDAMRLDFVQVTKSRPYVDYTLCDPSMIGSSDSLHISVQDDATTELYGYDVSFNDDVNQTFQDLVDKINEFGIVPISITLPHTAPFVSDGTAITLKLNGESPITISIPAGRVMEASELASFINSAISAAGQSSQGGANSNSGFGTVSIYSNVPGSAGSLEIVITNYGPDFFGLAPGLYTGVDLSTLVGNDTIRIKSPLKYGRLVVSATTSEAIDHGFTTNGTADSISYSVVQEVPATAEYVDVLIPESMEFWEVPDSNEQDEFKFNSYTSGHPVTGNAPSLTAGNPLIGPDGKLRIGAFPSKLGVVHTDAIRVGDNYASNWVVAPKILSKNSSLFFALMPSVLSGTSFPIRLFSGQDSMIYTINMTRDSALNSLWKLDSTANPGYFMEFKNGAISTGTVAPTSSTFADSTWARSLATDDTFESAKTVTIGGRSNTLASESPRLSIPRRDASTGATPSGNNRFTLLMESATNGSGAALPLRIYLTTSINSLSEEANAFMFCVNAKWNQTTGLWSRDVTSERSVAWVMGSQAISGSNQTSGIYVYNMNTNSWTSWTKVGEFSNTFDGTSHKGLVKFGTDPLHIVKAETVAKAWGVVSCSVSPLLSSNYNISSVTRAGTGQYNISFTNPVSTVGTISVTQRISNPITNAFVNVAGNITSTTTAAIYGASSSSTSIPATLVDDFQVSVVVLGS